MHAKILISIVYYKVWKGGDRHNIGNMTAAITEIKVGIACVKISAETELHSDSDKV